jgi:predicted extracellular nuclease
MRNIQSIVFIAIALASFSCFAQIMDTDLPPELKQKVENDRMVRIMFYNCENFFDTKNDSLVIDEEFLPEGDRNWNKNRYFEKQNHVSKVITAIGGWNPPDLVALCEIENRKILEGLTLQSPLYIFGYKIIHKESPDARGIDVGLLYKPEKYKPVKNEFLAVNYPHSSRKTRDILFSTGILPNGDTLHIFVNHWPSRYGGQLESEENRIFVASLLKAKTDSILTKNNEALIVLVGDFNDEPNNTSLLETLGAKPNLDSTNNKQLVNLSYNLQFVKNQGSNKYQGHWGILDQIIVSGALLTQSAKTYTTTERASIFEAPFLLEADEVYLGLKPFRTYIGFKYNGGFSDHLPVFIDLLKKE